MKLEILYAAQSRRIDDTAESWCGRGDLNPHAFRRHPLKMVCLPIPPLPQLANSLDSITWLRCRLRGHSTAPDSAPISRTQLYTPVAASLPVAQATSRRHSPLGVRTASWS